MVESTVTIYSKALTGPYVYRYKDSDPVCRLLTERLVSEIKNFAD